MGGLDKEIFISAHLNSYSLQKTRLLGTPIRMGVLPGGQRKGGGEGMGESGVGKTKGKGDSHWTADR